jgi:NAD(P)-dependent dehydrogenase (short-subunit alcohol dehydrogenase family)
MKVRTHRGTRQPWKRRQRPCCQHGWTGSEGNRNARRIRASKWGIRSLTLTAAYELARDRIHVNSVHPGIIDTPLAYNPDTGAELVPVDGFAIPRMASAEIARYVLFVASEEASFSTGSEFVADGGFGVGPIADPAP